MIKKIWIINKKNIKRLLSSRLSILFIILGPLILITLLGIAFGTSNFSGVNIGLHSEQDLVLITNLKNMLAGQQFNILEFENEKECIESTMTGVSTICISFSENNELDFFVDYSRVSLANTVLFAVSSQIDILIKDLSLDNTENILMFLQRSSNQIKQSMGDIDGMLASLVELQSSISLINSELSGFDIEDRAELLRQINDPDSELAINIERAKADLDLLGLRIDMTISELESFENIISDSKSNSNSAFKDLECDSKEYKDLTPYIEQGGFFDELQTSESQSCSLIHTISSIFNNRDVQIKETIDDLEELKRRTEQSKLEIDMLERNILAETEGIERDLISANESRGNIQDSLIELEESSRQGEIQITNMKNALLELSSSLEDISAYDAEDIITPISTSFSGVDDIDRNHLDYLFPGLLLLIIMFIGILLGSILVMKEKSSSANFRNKIMPTSNLVFMLSVYFTAIIFVFLQVIIFLIIGLFIFNSSIYIDFLLMIELFLASIVFISIGIIISSLSNSEEVAILSSISLCILMLMFSNLLVPVETMASILSFIAGYSPFNVFELVLRRHMTYGFDLLSLNTFNLITVFTQVGLFFGAAYALFFKKN